MFLNIKHKILRIDCFSRLKFLQNLKRLSQNSSHNQMEICCHLNLVSETNLIHLRVATHPPNNMSYINDGIDWIVPHRFFVFMQ